MKKVLILFLILAVAGGVFAIDLGEGFSINGDIKTGIRLRGQDDGDSDTEDIVADMYHDDKKGPRFILSAVYNGETFGAKGAIRIQDTELSSGSPESWTSTFGYGWVNLYKDVVKLTAGTLGGDAAWHIYGTWMDTAIDSRGTGWRLDITPTEGLSFGINMPLPGVRGFDWYTDTSTHVSEFKFSEAYRNLAFGVKYDGAISVVAAGKLDYNYDLDLGVNKDTTSDYASGFEALFGIFVPIESAGLNIDLTGYYASNDSLVLYDGVGSFDFFGRTVGAPGFKLIPHVAWGKDALSVYVYGIFTFPGKFDDHDVQLDGTKEPGDSSIGFRVGLGYAVNDFVAPYFFAGSDNVGYLDGNGIYARIGAGLTFGPNCSFDIYDQVGGIGADEDIYGKLSNTFQVSMNWSF